MILLYPGSFDPVTYGHIDIALRGAKLADKLIVAVLNNPNKKNKQMFSLKEREDFLRAVFSDYNNIEIASFSGLLAQYATMQGANALLRGLRSPNDFEAEYKYAVYNRILSRDKIDTIFVASAPELSHVSSSAVKEIAQYMSEFQNNENVLADIVPPMVLEALKIKYQKGF